jgi:hypothetical protein
MDGREIDLPLEVIREELRRQIALKVIRHDIDGKRILMWTEPFDAQGLYVWIKAAQLPPFWYGWSTYDMIILETKSLANANGLANVLFSKQEVKVLKDVEGLF